MNNFNCSTLKHEGKDAHQFRDVLSNLCSHLLPGKVDRAGTNRKKKLNVLVNTLTTTYYEAVWCMNKNLTDELINWKIFDDQASYDYNSIFGEVLQDLVTEHDAFNEHVSTDFIDLFHDKLIDQD